MWAFFEYAWLWGLVLASLAAAGAATGHAVLWKRDSRAVIGWVGLVWLAPLLGPLAYYCFGINRIHRKAVAMQLAEAWRDRYRQKLPRPIPGVTDELAQHFPQLVGLATLVEKVTNRELLAGNRITPLVNGDQAYPEMLKAIDSAEKSVALLSYIFNSDRAGDAFFDALVRAHQRGVAVRVLIDHVGSRASRPSMVKRLHNAGLTATTFLPTRAPRLMQYANLRNHRKILVGGRPRGLYGRDQRE